MNKEDPSSKETNFKEKNNFLSRLENENVKNDLQLCILRRSDECKSVEWNQADPEKKLNCYKVLFSSYTWHSFSIVRITFSL